MTRRNNLLSFRRARTATLFVLGSKFSITRSFISMPGVAVNALERSHANGGFGEPSCARVQGRQLLIQSEISGRLAQGSHQRSERLGRHILRNKQLGIG